MSPTQFAGNRPHERPLLETFQKQATIATANYSSLLLSARGVQLQRMAYGGDARHEFHSALEWQAINEQPMNNGIARQSVEQ
jgi:hypothetical protein